MFSFNKLDIYLQNDIYTLSYKLQYNDLINYMNNNLLGWKNFNDVYCSNDSKYKCNNNEYNEHMIFWITSI